MTEGAPTVAKPSRSDDVLDAAEQLQIYNQVRAQFDAMAPKRPTKPNRSEPDSVSTTIDHEHVHVPELDKLRSLQNQSQAILSQTTAVLDQEEFVETRYYKALDSIDKQHHTTGTGFIKASAVDKSGEGYNLELNGSPENGGGNNREMTFKTNPATNDWIPKLENYQVEFVSFEA